MAKAIYVGVGGKARKVKEIYVGVNGTARAVKKVYVGVGGKARLAWEDDTWSAWPSTFQGTLTITGETSHGFTTIYEQTQVFTRNGQLYTAPMFGGLDVSLSGYAVTGCCLSTDLSSESSGTFFSGAVLETSAGEQITLSQPSPGPAYLQAELSPSEAEALAVDGLCFTVTVMASDQV